MTIESETTTINNSRTNATNATNSDDTTIDCNEDNSLAYFIFKRSGLMLLTRIIISPFYLVRCIIYEICKCFNFYFNEYPSFSRHVCHLLPTILFAFLSVLIVRMMFIPSLYDIFLFLFMGLSVTILLFIMCLIQLVRYIYIDLNVLFVERRQRNRYENV